MRANDLASCFSDPADTSILLMLTAGLLILTNRDDSGSPSEVTVVSTFIYSCGVALANDRSLLR